MKHWHDKKKNCHDLQDMYLQTQNEKKVHAKKLSVDSNPQIFHSMKFSCRTVSKVIHVLLLGLPFV